MNDFITNQVISYRARLGCLNETLHRAIWLNQPPLIFTTKVTQATTTVEELETMAGLCRLFPDATPAESPPSAYGTRPD